MPVGGQCVGQLAASACHMYMVDSALQRLRELSAPSTQPAGQAYTGWTGQRFCPAAACKQRRCLEATVTPHTNSVGGWHSSCRRDSCPGDTARGPRQSRVAPSMVRIIDARLYHPRDDVEAREWRYIACQVVNDRMTIRSDLGKRAQPTAGIMTRRRPPPQHKRARHCCQKRKELALQPEARVAGHR